MVYKFTKSGEKVIDFASDAVIYLGHNYIGSEHILYGLAEEGTGIASKVLENQEINSENVKQEIEEIIGRDNPIDDLLRLHYKISDIDFDIKDILNNVYTL